MDIFSCAFQVEKRRQDSGFMLLKHSKYCFFVIFHVLEESVYFFVFGWLWGVILGGLVDLWGLFCIFARGLEIE